MIKIGAALVLFTATCAFAKDVWLRETHFIIYEVEAGEEVAFTMEPQARGTAGRQPMHWRVYDEDGARIAEAAPQFGTVTVRYTPQRSGLNVARLIGGRNWYVLAPAEGSDALADDRFGIVSSTFAHLHTCGDAKPTYFYVPEGTGRVTAFVLADSPKEGATFRLVDPEGNVAAEESGQFDRPTKMVADVPEGRDGSVWSINLAPAEGMPFDDVVVWFEADGSIPPLTGYNPEALEHLLQVIPGAPAAGE
ncbi:MAG: hypothetical protein ACOC7J_05785 [Armatimonadota bacterium]